MATSSTRIGQRESDTRASGLARQQVSRRWRVAWVLSALAAACLVTATPAVPGASQAFAQGSGGARVKVLSPRPQALVQSAGRKAAARREIRARIRVTGGRVAHVSVRLNGHRVRAVAAGRGKRRMLLSKRNGLAVGYNVLLVRATLAGSDRPLQVARRFVVGYPAKHLLTARVRRGAGSAPAALVRVRAPLRGLRRVSATLNGRRLRLPGARRAKHGRRVLNLNLAQRGRLRFGRNHVRFRTIMNDGRVHVLRRRFTLDRRRDIAVARLVGGRAGRAVTGRTLTLDASRSRLAGGRLRGHWFLLRKPRLSHARLRSPAGTTSRLRPDVPGTYLVGLRTRSGAGAGYDVLAVSATDPELLVPIDTAATQNGKPGLQVGDQFYAYDANAIQVVQLNGYTLEATHINTYQATSQSLSQMKSDLSSASLDALVFIAAPDGRPDLPSDQVGNLDAALGEVGGNLGAGYRFGDSNCWTGNTVDCITAGLGNAWTNTTTDLGPFTIVGVPGSPAQSAWRETAAQTSAGGGAGTGGITGYLSPGVASTVGMTGTYTLIPGPDPFLPVVSCAGPQPCAVTVGDKTYPSPGANGVHVVILDRTTLTLQSNRTVTTYDDLHTAINVTQSGVDPTTKRVVHYVTNGGQSDQSLVVIQSVGNGTLTGTPSTYLYQDLSELGGTPESLLGSLTSGRPYALVGVADNLPWYGTSGLESSPVMATSSAPGQPNGQVNGMLQRGRTGMFTPVTGNGAGPINPDLFAIVFQAPQPWPYDGDPALPYIADGIGMSGYPDVRSGYLNLGIDFDSKTNQLQDLRCVGQTFCGQDFNEVKSELLKEFAWVMTVRTFVENLASPLSQGGAGAIFAVDAIYDDVRNSLPPPPPVETGLDWFGLITDVVDVATAFALPGSAQAYEALSVATTGVTIGDAFVQSPGGGSADTVSADAPDQLSAQLADQQTAAVESIERLGPILLSDYGKLSVVGTKAGGGDPSWAWTTDTTLDAITAFNASTRGQSYTSLIPEIYKVSSLEPDSSTPSTYATTNDVTEYACDDGHHPFAAALPQNQFHAVSRFYNNETQSNVWTFANNVSSSPQMPTTSLTDDIYGPDAMGADGAAQYGPDWWRTTFNPPGGVQCHPPNPGATWNAPAISQPPP